MMRILVWIGLGLFVVVPQFAFTIGESEQGVIVQFGEPKRIIKEPGLYMKLPMIQQLIRFEKRILSADARIAEYLTLDKKRVMVDQVSRWQIIEPLDFYRSVRDLERAQARLDDVSLGAYVKKSQGITFSIS